MTVGVVITPPHPPRILLDFCCEGVTNDSPHPPRIK